MIEWLIDRVISSLITDWFLSELRLDSSTVIEEMHLIYTTIVAHATVVV
ncbi:hypothetical protein VCR12J2_1020051 [Vibrio coralliirubri]|nr:hypothetical protein VCR12J2_1020051 [Vibrio coralliirubri]